MNRYARSFTAGLSDGDKLEFEYEVIITAGNSAKARRSREVIYSSSGLDSAHQFVAGVLGKDQTVRNLHHEEVWRGGFKLKC